MDILVWLPILMRLIELAPKISQAMTQKQSVNDLVKGLAPDLLPVLKQVGAQMFPRLDPAKQIDAGALVFDPARVRWIQEAMNKLVPGAKLVVDGHYGEHTKAAVSAFQTKQGLEVDGWAGNKTSAAIERMLG